MRRSRLEEFWWIIIICTWISGYSIHVCAQNPYFINYQVGDGLPSNFTYSVFQDSEGYIWIGTDLGASRFDGASFNNFSTKDGLADNEIFDFFEDSQGRIWFHTFNGEVSYYHDGVFYNPDNHPSLWKSTRGNYISHITEDEQQNILMSFYTEYGYLKIKDGQSPIWNEKPYRRLSASFIFHSGDEELYLCTEIGICNFEGEMKIAFADYNFSMNRGTTRSFETEQLLFIGKGKNIIIIDKQTLEVIHIIRVPAIETEIINIRYLNDKLFAGTRDGVFELTATQAHFRSFTFKKYLDGYNVSSTLIDREQNLWFSTLEAGIFFSPNNASQHWTSSLGLINNQVTSIDKDQKDRLWIGYPEYRYAILANGKFKNHQLVDPNPLEIQRTVHFGADEHWVLGQRQMMLYDSVMSKYFFVAVDDLIKDEYGFYWIGHNNLFRLDQKDLLANLVDENDPNFEQLIIDRSTYFLNIEPIDSKRFICLENDGQRRIYAGTTNGLKCYEYDSLSVIKQYEISSIKGKINALAYDSQNQYLWVSNSTDGIMLLKNDSLIRTFDESSGLSANFITSLHLDEAYNLWVGTTKGVDRIYGSESNLQLERFSREHGLFNLKVNDLTTLKEKVYIATDEGIITLPKQLPVLNKQPGIRLTKGFVNEKAINIDHPLKLSHDENDIQFVFSTLSYRDQGHIIYQYRLLGNHSDWLNTTEETIRYNGLAPGEYNFEIKAINELGRSSPSPAVFTFKIKAPFWQKAWFIILLALAITAVSILLVQRRIRQLRKKHQLQQQLSTMRNDRLELEKQFLDLEMRALRIQMNPHFMFNALNTIKGYYAQNKVREANAYISKFGKLLRMILQNNEKYISLEEEIDILQFYIDLVKIRYDDKFDYTIEVDPLLQPDDIALPPMLLQPIVENAIIHGLAPLKIRGHIHISFHTDGQCLIATVRDNGIGRKASAQLNKHKMHQSKAIQITKDRLAIINKDKPFQNYFRIHDLSYPDGAPAGTEVVLKTPYKKRW